MAKDLEGAAAFLNDYTPWKDKSDRERKEWQKRARALTAGTTPFGKFTYDDLAAVCGLTARSTIHARLAWSETDSESLVDKNRRAKKYTQRAEQFVRKAVKDDPEFVAQAVAKVDPDILLDVATEAQGQTRKTAPSNKAKVEQAFGPEEFNRLEYAIEGVLERLPDLAPNKDDKVYANELADKAETVASILRDWANGQDIGSEVEAWLGAK